ncbi:MAG: hypothetical protein ORN98_03005 [Alphaproteobacteria bacterium]|nr:hypothetical protein [Alphaproteobacteria bacterium]
MKNPGTASPSHPESLNGHTNSDGFDQAAWQRSQKQRNTALFWVLLGLVALFFAISIVQFARGGHL